MLLPFEPFRIKSVETVRPNNLEERRAILRSASFDLFRVPAESVLIDLLTDSGTSALSSDQWAAMMRTSDAYAASPSYFHLVDSVYRITGFPNLIPVHQGRAAEQLLAQTLITPELLDRAAKSHRTLTIPNNAHFDTTRRALESVGATTLNLLTPAGTSISDPDPFKGNLDTRPLSALLTNPASLVPFILLTLTCNSNGGHPVSLENAHSVRRLADRHNIPLIFDACRIIENAALIKLREPSQSHRPVRHILRDLFDLADGVVMSTRKDALANSGGLLLFRDSSLHKSAASRTVITQGFTASYGPLPGRELECIALGLHEASEDHYILQRVNSIASLARKLSHAGIPIVQPAGGHAVFIDALSFLPHIPLHENPAHLLACHLYLHAGIRATRIGSVLHAHTSRASLSSTASFEPTPAQLLRLAIPRRAYTQSHLDYVADSLIELKSRAHELSPLTASSITASSISASPASAHSSPSAYLSSAPIIETLPVSLPDYETV